MSYDTIHHSTLFYSINGYEKINVPWLVDEQVSNITKPKERKNFFVQNKVLVASAEQSFLQMMLNNELKQSTKYFAVTPCFRDEKEDELHKIYFMKSELFYYEDKSNDPKQIDKLNQILSNTVSICTKFFEFYLSGKIKKVSTNDGTIDLLTLNNIELGSYGLKEYKGKFWIFATGCAEPRLSYAISQELGPIGYHEMIIPKTSFTEKSIFKITEEYNEFIDSVKQGSSVMELVELSDLIGAIEKYTKDKYNINLDDLIKFKNITKRAFENGKRTSS